MVPDEDLGRLTFGGAWRDSGEEGHGGGRCLERHLAGKPQFKGGLCGRRGTRAENPTDQRNRQSPKLPRELKIPNKQNYFFKKSVFLT